MRSRTCNDPPPSGGGLDCVGHSTEVQLCNTPACPGRFSMFAVTEVLQSVYISVYDLPKTGITQ